MTVQPPKIHLSPGNNCSQPKSPQINIVESENRITNETYLPGQITLISIPASSGRGTS